MPTSLFSQSTHNASCGFHSPLWTHFCRSIPNVGSVCLYLSTASSCGICLRNDVVPCGHDVLTYCSWSHVGNRLAISTSNRCDTSLFSDWRHFCDLRLDAMSLVNNEIVRGCLCNVFQNDMLVTISVSCSAVCLRVLIFHALWVLYGGWGSPLPSFAVSPYPITPTPKPATTREQDVQHRVSQSQTMHMGSICGHLQRPRWSPRTREHAHDQGRCRRPKRGWCAPHAPGGVVCLAAARHAAGANHGAPGEQVDPPGRPRLLLLIPQITGLDGISDFNPPAVRLKKMPMVYGGL